MLPFGRNQDGQICSVKSCCNYAIQKNARSMFRFPKDIDLCKKWILAICRFDLLQVLETKGSEHINKSHRICSDHFAKKCFRNPNLHSQGLFKGAVPSLLLGPSHSSWTGTSVQTSSESVKRLSATVLDNNSSIGGLGSRVDGEPERDVVGEVQAVEPVKTTADQCCMNWDEEEDDTCVMDHLEVCYGSETPEVGPSDDGGGAVPVPNKNKCRILWEKKRGIHVTKFRMKTLVVVDKKRNDNGFAIVKPIGDHLFVGRQNSQAPKVVATSAVVKRAHDAREEDEYDPEIRLQDYRLEKQMCFKKVKPGSCIPSFPIKRIRRKTHSLTVGVD